MIPSGRYIRLRGKSQEGEIFQMKKTLLAIIATTVVALSLAVPCFAGSWEMDNTGWWWKNDDGSYPANCWQWIDGNRDGVAESYCFNEAGYLLTNTTTPDGYQVDANGAWIVDGKVQTRAAAVSAGSGSQSTEPVLPNPHYWFNEKLRHEEIPYDTKGGYCVRFQFDRESSEAAHAYADLLSDGDYSLVLFDKGEVEKTRLTETLYLYDYTGSAEVNDVDFRGYKASVIICIYDYKRPKECEMEIMFSKAFRLVDNGDRSADTSYTDGISKYIGFLGDIALGDKFATYEYDDSSDDAERSGSSSGSSGSNHSSNSGSTSSGSKWTPCWKCHGDGEVECSQCGGSGGKWDYGSVPNYSGHSQTSYRTWDRCFRCGGTGDVTCSVCGGSGRTYY